ncbi:Scr1 family TA system antitoxin-like transcriptional regulator [Saccharopolyspora pogona]|uniref:Scr1 family TA system antitoxin-like transcriptional regulator n=1 Tax=Saccharopolyspora pogona TaxID=333966 RepID=UPI001CC24091|nr:Scr1 family TA system antitoxin-like transcriptional regulator [Saccharopolyspora pogona]
MRRPAGTVGTVWVMREQLDHLEEMALQQNVDLQVLPFDVETPGGGISFDFTMLRIPSDGIAADLEFVYVECLDDADIWTTRMQRRPTPGCGTNFRPPSSPRRSR